MTIRAALPVLIDSIFYSVMLRPISAATNFLSFSLACYAAERTGLMSLLRRSIWNFANLICPK